MYFFKFLIVFLFCSLTISVYCNSSSNLRFRDIDATTQDVVFRNRSISDIHKDLIHTERQCNYKLKNVNSDSTTNLVVGKFVIFYDDDTEKEIHLHELSQKQLMIVFDSGNHRKDIIEALKSTSGVSFQESMIDVDSVVTHTAHNFPAIPESKSFMNNRKDTMLVAIESKRTLSDALKECEKKRTEWFSLMEIGSKKLDAAKSEFRKCEDKLSRFFTAYHDNLSPLVISVWHSEPRVLSLLKENLKPRSLLDDSRNPSIIILNLHSTNNVCDCCRLQLVGSTYNWLYEAVICALGKVTQTPKFHIIVTWFDEFDKSTKKPISSIEIKETDFAIYDLAHPNHTTFSSIEDGFFLTLVKLDKAKFSTIMVEDEATV